MYQRCSTPAQARCHSEADLREAAKLSTSRRQNSDHGGPCSIRSRRRSASRRHLSRPSVSCFTDAEKNASLACASSLIERDCSTSMRKRFISMSSSFSSRRMTGNGSGASQGWGPRNGVMMTTFAAALIWRAIACRSVVYSWLRYGRTLEISKLCAQRSDGRRWHVCRDGGTPPEARAGSTSFILTRSLRQKRKACSTRSCPRVLSTREWMERYGEQPAAEASFKEKPAAEASPGDQSPYRPV